MNPPMNEPTMPRTIVCNTLIGSGPGTSSQREKARDHTDHEQKQYESEHRSSRDGLNFHLEQPLCPRQRRPKHRVRMKIRGIATPGVGYGGAVAAVEPIRVELNNSDRARPRHGTPSVPGSTSSIAPSRYRTMR